MPIIVRDFSGLAKRDGKANSGHELLVNDGPTVEVLVRPCRKQWSAQPHSEDSPALVGLAIVDSGAKQCCIDRCVAKGWGLKPVGESEFHTASDHWLKLPIYPIEIQLLGISGWFRVNAAGNCLHSMGLKAIIGRDVLRHGKMIYDGPGSSLLLDIPDQPD